MQCELCGKNSDKIYKTLIEGVRMAVCQSCAGHGKIINEVRPAPKAKELKRIEPRVVEEEKHETFYKVRDDYARIIRNTRTKLSLTQEEFAKKVNEKESIIHNMENGKHPPSLVLAKKLEKLLTIVLIEEYEEKHEKLRVEAGELTLGDIINIKDKTKK